MSNVENNAIELLKNIDKQKCMMLECPVVKNNITRQLKIIELNKLIRKQNKIIDLMAKDLKTPVNSKEWIIEYYKKRCEDAKD